MMIVLSSGAGVSRFKMRRRPRPALGKENVAKRPAFVAAAKSEEGGALLGQRVLERHAVGNPDQPYGLLGRALARHPAACPGQRRCRQFGVG